jgi:hypothetical protein
VGSRVRSDGPRPALDAPRLLYERAEAPSEDVPIAYRERVFVVDSLQDDDGLEAQLLSELERVLDLLADRDAPLFVQLALFDHRFEGEPAAPPIGTLSWKDWQGTAEIWLRGVPRPEPIPLVARRRSEPPPAPPAAPDPPPPPSRATPGPLSEAATERLGRLFERMHELLYVSDARSATLYVQNALESHIDADGALVYLLDEPGQELSVERALGPSPKAVLGTRSLRAGSLIEEALRTGSTLRLDASSDAATLERWRTLGVELYTGVCAPVRAAGRTLGAIELARARGGVAFDRGEMLALEYVCDQLADFLVSLD